MTVISLVVAVAIVVSASPGAAQSPVGALAVDERQGDRWSLAVDYETAAAARAVALRDCGSGCSVVLTFDRCGAYAADQDDASEACGRSVRPADAGGDTELAVGEGYPGDRVPGRPASRGATCQGRVPTAGVGKPAAGRGGRGCPGAGSRVLAVHREQHEPGRVRCVSGAVPERGVSCTGGGPTGGVTRFRGVTECGWRRWAPAGAHTVPVVDHNPSRTARLWRHLLRQGQALYIRPSHRSRT